MLKTAFMIKPLMGQIHVMIHALGIMHYLPYILEPNEKVVNVSLGADGVEE